ncbi:MAG: hypothetical protein NC124_19610 [Clostridium sp.]|nr:hypothetical protein [Ruminococcus flavefaciens]MCM1500675.1 hypothetical protein [Clostridium sp.]
MSSIKDTGFFRWVEACEKKEFPSIDPNADTYFESVSDKNPVIEEYDFHNIPQAVDMLNKHVAFEDTALIQVCAIEMFQSKPHTSKVDSNKNEQVEIPDFVYVF